MTMDYSNPWWWIGWGILSLVALWAGVRFVLPGLLMALWVLWDWCESTFSEHVGLLIVLLSLLVTCGCYFVVRHYS